MLLSFTLAALCALPFLALILLILLFVTGLDYYINDERPLDSCLGLIDRVFKSVFSSGASYPYLHRACFSLVAAYLVIPMGSLPSYFRTPMNLVFLIAILAFAQSSYIKGVKVFASDIYLRLDDNEHFALSGFGIALITVYGSLALFILDRGVPGNLMSLESITAMPLWNIAGIFGKAGFACFFILFAIASPHRGVVDIRQRSEVPFLELYDVIRSGLAPAVSAAMFLPWNPAILFGLRGTAMFSLDFVFFWIKVFILQVLLFPLINKFYLKINDRFPENLKNMGKIGVGATGVIFFLVDMF